MNRIACVVFLFITAVALAAPQREITNVEVVQVPVYVTAQGQAVRGLGQDNFQLFVNGKPQPIDYFDVIDFARFDASRPDPRQRRLYLLVFDLVFTTPDAVYRAQAAAAKYVDAAPDSDLFAIASFTSNRGLQLVVPFTRDRLAVRGAINRLREKDTGDPLRLAMTLGERSAILDANMRFDGGIAARDGNQAIQTMLLEPLLRIAGNEIDELGDVATRLAPLEGQKHLVLLSTGFDTSMFRSPAGFGGRDDTRRAGLTPQRSAFSFGDPSIMHRLRTMHEKFTAAGVFLDAVDVFGLAGPWEPSNNEALFALTLNTGGSVIHNRNDLTAAMQTLADRQRVVYVLGFHAGNTGREKNSISVKVRNTPGGSRVNYRPSYSTTLPKPSSTDGLRLADILQNDIPQTGMTVSAGVTSAGRSATVSVDIPSTELAALAGIGKGEGDALIYIYSGHAVVAFDQKMITADRSRFTQTFDLPPGRYTAKVLVRWAGVLGFARAAFTVE